MESPIKEFEHINSEFTLSTTIASSIFLLALLGFLFLYKRKTPYYKKKEKQVYMLLLSFTMLIAFGMALFSWLSNMKMQQIKLFKNSIELPEKKIKLSKIKNAYIYVHLEKSSLSSNIVRDTIKMLILEERNGQTHAISENNYEINDILESLKQLKKTKLNN